jgi:hypothetical protein
VAASAKNRSRVAPRSSRRPSSRPQHLATIRNEACASCDHFSLPLRRCLQTETQQGQYAGTTLGLRLRIADLGSGLSVAERRIPADGWHRSFPVVDPPAARSKTGLVLALTGRGAGCTGVTFRVAPGREATLLHCATRACLLGLSGRPAGRHRGRAVGGLGLCHRPRPRANCHLDREEQAQIIAQATVGAGGVALPLVHRRPSGRARHPRPRSRLAGRGSTR